VLIYDIEIAQAIQGKEPRQSGIRYCQGWKDFAGMGISVMCCYDYDEERYRVFMNDNMNEVETLFRKHDIIIGFNSISFDNNVLACEVPDLTKGYLDGKSYDILVEIWKAAGLSPTFKYPSHIGYSLDAMVKANDLASGKTGNGAAAPVWYQLGRYGKLIDYCMADVWLTKKLMDKILEGDSLINPKNGEWLVFDSPKQKKETR